jgi:hypothetical protein
MLILIERTLKKKTCSRSTVVKKHHTLDSLLTTIRRISSTSKFCNYRIFAFWKKIVTKSEREMKEMMKTLGKYVRKKKVEVNVEKTKMMVFNKRKRKSEENEWN